MRNKERGRRHGHHSGGLQGGRDGAGLPSGPPGAEDGFMGVSPGPLCLLVLGAALLSTAAASTWRLAPEACPEKSGKLEVGGASRDSTGFGALEEGLISS